MKKFVLAFLVFFVVAQLTSLAQVKTAQQPTAAPVQVTTFILLRHAEKAVGDTSDPDLSEAGKVRAGNFVKMLKDTKIDAIYSTNFKRTRETVTPLSLIKGLSITPYEGMKAEEIDQILKKYVGKTVVICGHSNTTPWIANYLTGKTDLKDFDDTDYDNVLLIDVLSKGKAKLTWLSY